MKLIKRYPMNNKEYPWAIFQLEDGYLMAWPTILAPKRIKFLGSDLPLSGPLVHWYRGTELECLPGKRCKVARHPGQSYLTLDAADLEECDTIEQMFESFVLNAEFYLTKEVL